ncbi:TPA: beta-lactamase family protein [Legionella pneumophila]|nr:beta-lactamase family protein [Legionella pneumophila]
MLMFFDLDISIKLQLEQFNCTNSKKVRTMKSPFETIIEQAQIPGVSVAITSPAGEIMTQAAGVTNKAAPQAVTDTTVFEAASLSKPVFAYLIIKMAERGEIALDKPLYEYFSDRYTLALMSELPEGNHELAEVGKIYLSASNYIVRDPNGKVQQGKLDEKIDLSDLTNRLTDPKLKNNILDLTSKRGHTDGFGPLEMRAQENYKKLTARKILSHQAGLPNEFDPEHGAPFAYTCPVGEGFDYSGEAFRFLQEVVEKIMAPKMLEDIAQEEFAKIGMTHSSFLPPTGCSLVKLPDVEGALMPEHLDTLLNSQVGIICAGDKLYVAERRDGSLLLTEKKPGLNEAENLQLESMKASIKSLPGANFSRPAEAYELPIITSIIGHRPKDCAESLAVGHDDKGNANLNQRFYGVHSAGSLYTTAIDYGKFLKQCTTDEFVRKEMFTSIVPTLTDRDTKAMTAGVSPDTLGQIAWGVGIGLQQTPDGRRIAFHWGDNHSGRNFAAIDLSTNQSVACFTNSAHGPSIFQKIAEPVVGSLTPVSRWLSRREKLNFNSTAIYREAITSIKSEEAKTDAKSEITGVAPNPFETTPK